MAKAIVYETQVEIAGDGLAIRAEIAFFGGGINDLSVATLNLTGDETPVQIRQALVNAVLAEATRLGYSVVATSIILPAFQKGA